MTTVVDGTLGVNRVRDDAVVGGDLVFGGPASRIYGDFSNSNQSQRLLFQSSVLNGTTNVGAIPNGTNRRSQFSCFGNVDPANASTLTMVADETAGSCFFAASANGTGTFLPLVFQTGGAERFRLSATANVFQADWSNATAASRFSFQTSTVNGSTSFQIIPNGTGNSSGVDVMNASDPTNASRTTIACTNVDSRIMANANGSGTQLPLILGTAGLERMRIQTNGDIMMSKAVVDFAQAGFGFEWASKITWLTNSSNNALVCRRNTSDGSVVTFYRDGTAVGAINITTTNTNYATTSDYRLKKNVQAMAAPLARLLRLKPVRFDWKLNDSEGEGFLAHELQEEVPLAVFGEKDGEEMQGVDLSKVVPLLVAAVQELTQRLEMANERIAVLEAL